MTIDGMDGMFDNAVVSVGPVGVDESKAWHACEFPERPPDGNMMLHVVPDCRGCDVARLARIKRLTILPCVMNPEDNCSAVLPCAQCAWST